jgi:hypothetical protein
MTRATALYVVSAYDSKFKRVLVKLREKIGSEGVGMHVGGKSGTHKLGTIPVFIHAKTAFGTPSLVDT